MGETPESNEGRKFQVVPIRLGVHPSPEALQAAVQAMQSGMVLDIQTSDNGEEITGINVHVGGVGILTAHMAAHLLAETLEGLVEAATAKHKTGECGCEEAAEEAPAKAPEAAGEHGHKADHNGDPVCVCGWNPANLDKPPASIMGALAALMEHIAEPAK